MAYVAASIHSPANDSLGIAASIRSHATDRFRVILGVAIAHELVHCFMNYLFDGDNTRITPTEILGEKFPKLEYGDLGTMWEFQVLGGKFTIYKELDHRPLANNQAGIVWLDKLDGNVEQLEISKKVDEPGGILGMLTPLV